RQHRDDQVPGTVRERVLHASELNVVVFLAQAVDHVRAGVQADHPGIRVGLEEDSRRLSRSDPELQDAVRRERDRVHGGSLELVVARYLAPDLLQVSLRVPVELSAQGLPLTSERVYAEGGIVDLERLALSSGQARTLDLELDLDPI